MRAIGLITLALAVVGCSGQQPAPSAPDNAADTASDESMTGQSGPPQAGSAVTPDLGLSGAIRPSEGAAPSAPEPIAGSDAPPPSPQDTPPSQEPPSDVQSQNPSESTAPPNAADPMQMPSPDANSLPVGDEHLLARVPFELEVIAGELTITADPDAPAPSFGEVVFALVAEEPWPEGDPVGAATVGGNPTLVAGGGPDAFPVEPKEIDFEPKTSKRMSANAFRTTVDFSCRESDQSSLQTGNLTEVANVATPRESQITHVQLRLMELRQLVTFTCGIKVVGEWDVWGYPPESL